MPPIEGLHDICPSVSMLWVSRRVRQPIRAAASAASVPAWPPPTTMTSNSTGNSMGTARFYAIVQRGTSCSSLTVRFHVERAECCDATFTAAHSRMASLPAARALRGELLVHTATSHLECVRQALAKLGEKLVVRGEFVFPGRDVDPGELGVLRRRELFQPRPIKVLVARHQAKRCFHALRAPLRPLDDPLQHAHVLGESRPDEPALRVAPEPVDAKDLRRMLHSAPHFQPVSEIVTHVIATEGKHRHRIAPHDTHFPGNRGGRLG